MKFSGRIPRLKWYLYSVWQGN
ncbi:hypothetical protein MTR67_033006 [Solanum verrucosum]|uniref:Uncharacterized protein n=1 Tax=Solanum verrucosum TaxID=315347 RepID=A0AAF0U5M2_SOLVR|nr:hypothetical protein MTR67_033006 [Solanum verrucosum]